MYWDIFFLSSPSNVEEDETEIPAPKKSRKGYSNQKKAAIILKFLEAQHEDPNISFSVFVELEKIPSKSMLYKWVQDNDNILKRAYEGCIFKENQNEFKEKSQAC